jgi:hypothetical protein
MANFIPSLGVFALGMVVIFLGITVLIGFVVLQKYSIAYFEKKPKNKIIIKNNEIKSENNEVPLEIRLAIIAAISAYYENKTEECEFKVKRIKRLG